MSEVDAFCRTCMHQFSKKPKENNECYNIFKTRNLANMLMQCSQLHIYPSDEYPHSVCAKCYKTILDFFQFQRMCKDSAIAFKEILSIGMQENSDARISLDNSTIVDKPFTKDTKPKYTENTAQISEVDTPCGKFDLDETFVDDQLIEFSINDTMFEDGCGIENLLIPNKEKALSVKGIANRIKAKDVTSSKKILKNENAEHEIKTPKKLSNAELSNSDLDISLENVSECGEEIVANSHCKDDELLDSNLKTAQPKLLFRCNLCPKLFRFKHHLIDHKLQHNGLSGFPSTRSIGFPRQIYKCDINGCGLEYTTKQAINLHLQKQHNIVSAVPDSKYVCETCGAVLKNTRALHDHQLLHLDKSLWPFKCSVVGCEKRFRMKEHYKQHKNRHDGIKPYACTHCGKRFCTSSNLNAHVNFHTLEKKWLCSFCPKVAYTPANLRQHIQKKHQNNPEATRTISCRFCNKALSSYTARKHHEMIHTGEKPYVCEVCGRGFTQPANLNVHMRTHEENRIIEERDKKFNCQLCDRSFASSLHLKNHVLKHTGEKPYECAECDVKFRYPSNLKRHQRDNLCRKTKNLTNKNQLKECNTELSYTEELEN